jgi:casein kinase II subunit alpha
VVQYCRLYVVISLRPHSFALLTFVRDRKNNVDQLIKIVSVLGTEDLITYCEKYGIQLTQEMVDAIGHHCPKKPWHELCNGVDCPTPTHKASQLLDRLLAYDQDRRFTAAEAMKHSFFDQVRKEILQK